MTYLIYTILHKISNTILTLAVYFYKFTRPKKEQHHLLVTPPNMYDFGAENGVRDYMLKQTKNFYSELNKKEEDCLGATFGYINKTKK